MNAIDLVATNGMTAFEIDENRAVGHFVTNKFVMKPTTIQAKQKK